MARPLRIPALAGIILFAACREPITNPLPQDNEPLASAQQSIPSQPTRAKWRIRLAGDYTLHTPGVGPDGTVYVSLPNGRLVAVAPDGTQRWVFQVGLGGGVYGPVSVGGDGTIYVAGAVPAPGGGGTTGGIIAVTPAGTQKWMFNGAEQFIIAGPNVGPDGNIYAVTDVTGIGLFSLTPAGQLRFSVGSFSERGPLGQSIAFGTNQLYFAFDMYATGRPSTLFAYDLSGAQRFEVAGVANNAQPAVGPNGNVVVETFPTGVGLSLSSYAPTGGLIWSFYEFPGNTEERPDVGPDNAAYTVRNLATLFAFNASGSERWRYVDNGILFQPRVRPQNDLVFMGGRITYGQPGFFQAVSTTGTPLWRVDLPDEPGFAPYGQLVPMSRPVFSPDGNTAYGVVDVAGDGSSPNPYCYLYAIDLTAGGSPGNTAPTALLTATSPTTINRGGSVSFRGSFTDPDSGDGPWTLRWMFANGNTTTSAAAPGSYTATRSYPNAGTFKVTLRVRDARGGADTSNVVTVRVR